MIEFKHGTDRLRFQIARRRNEELSRETEASMAWQRVLQNLPTYPQGEAEHRKKLVHLDSRRKKK